MKQIKSLFPLALLIISLFSGCLLLTETVQATDVPTRIDTNSTWTKTGGPYSLTGNTLVAEGVTLTIEAGATINLNNHYIYVNGTLRAIGSSTDIIRFNGGLISFTKYAENYSENEGKGSIIKYANFANTGLTIDSSQKIDFCTLSDITACGSSIVSNSNISNMITVADNPTVSYNTIGGNVEVSSYSSPVITGNQITGKIFVPYMAQHTQITYNTISGGIETQTQVDNTEILHNTIYGGIIVSGNTSTVSYNIISGGIAASSNQITIYNNTVKDCAVGISLGGSSWASSVNGSVINNKISATNTGISVSASFSDTLYVWHTTAVFSGNTIYGCSENAIFIGGATYAAGNGPLYNAITIQNNMLYNNKQAVESGGISKIESNYILNNQVGIKGGNNIKNNIISGNEYGVWSGVTVEGNLIVNNQVGVYSCTAINGNTITKNTLAFKGTFTTANGNNIINNQKNVNYTGTKDADATNNWWGTTDLNAINQTIYDAKNDVLLGRVNFVPVLSALNSSAPSADTFIPNVPAALTEPSPTPSVPEFGNSIIIIAALAAFAVTLTLTVKTKKPKFFI